MDEKTMDHHIPQIYNVFSQNYSVIFFFLFFIVKSVIFFAKL